MQVLSARSRASPSTAHVGILLFHRDTLSPDYKFCLYTHTGLREKHSSLSSPLYQTVSKSFLRIFIFLRSTVPLRHDTNPVFYSLYQSSDKEREILLSLYRFSFLKYKVNNHFCFYLFFRIFTKTSKHQNKGDSIPPSLLPHLLLVLPLNSARKEVLYRIFLIRDCIFLSSCTFKTQSILWLVAMQKLEISQKPSPQICELF